VALLDGALDGARSWLTVARDASRGLGAADLAPPVAAALGFALAAAGGHDESVATLSAAVADAEGKGLKAHHALRLAWWAEAERLAGDIEKAEALATRALETARRHGERGHEAWALLALANATAARDAARAESLRQEALRLAEHLGMQPLISRLP
jgi:tetratricopeptide (TPR) repeat protein